MNIFLCVPLRLRVRFINYYFRQIYKKILNNLVITEIIP